MDRSVANLSTEQLYRKRASDRANQRALRARQKTRVQELEEEVADLKKKLDRSERRVNYLENNEQSLREIIESAPSRAPPSLIFQRVMHRAMPFKVRTMPWDLLPTCRLSQVPALL